METLWSRDEDVTLYEDERVAVEIGNGESGATIYVMGKGEHAVEVTRYSIAELLTEQAPGRG